MEDRLNIKLFKRNHKEIKITPEGKVVLEYVKKSYNDISVGERSLKENRNLNSGKISIGVQSHVGRFFLFPYLEEFHKKYPNIEINISSRNTAELIKLLENNEIDFVIDTSPIETEYSNLFNLFFVICLSLSFIALLYFLHKFFSLHLIQAIYFLNCTYNLLLY